MKLCLAIRDWVDECLAGPRAMSIADIPLMLPLLLLALITFSLFPSPVAFGTLLVAGIPWVAFVSWRGWRLGKADALKRDRREKKAGKNEPRA